ncbi:MAG: hypothetical protein R3C59_09925 [Planctomycetaceae bacterium]
MFKQMIPLLAVSVGVMFANTVHAGGFDDLVEAMLKKPLRVVDDVDKPLLTQSDAVKLVPSTQKADDELLKQFNRLEGANDDLRGAFKKLSTNERNALVEIVAAGQRVARTRDADDAIALIRKLDADGLVQVRTYGDFVYEGVDKMGPSYKTVVAKMGKGAGIFFNEWVGPHWGKWTAAGLTAGYLAAPEKFHDGLGKLTEYAIQKLTEAGIRAGEAATGGFTKAIITRVEANPIFATATLAIITFVLLLQIPLFRQLINRKVVRRLFNLSDHTSPSAEEQDRQQRSKYEE